MIRTEKLCKNYNGFPAVKNVRVDISQDPSSGASWQTVESAAYESTIQAEDRVQCDMGQYPERIAATNCGTHFNASEFGIRQITGEQISFVPTESAVDHKMTA